MHIEQLSPYEFVAYLPNNLGTPTLRVRNTVVPLLRYRYVPVSTAQQKLYNRNTFIADLNVADSNLLDPNRHPFTVLRLELETSVPVAEQEKFEIFFSQQPFGIV